MKTFRFQRAQGHEQGVVLAAAVSMIAVLGVLLIALLGSVTNKSKWTETQASDSRTDAITEMAIALAADRVWSGFERAYGPDQMQPWNFKTYLTDLGIADQAGIANAVGTDFLDLVNVRQDGEGDYPLGAGFLVGLQVVRRDTWDAAQIVISAEANLGRSGRAGTQQHTSTAQQIFDVDRAPWAGLDFALLANNVNCILCHAKIDSAERFYNNDSSIRGEFERIRVGSLESIHMREDPESEIAGALYLGGDALLSDGSKLTDWGLFNLKSAEWDATSHLTEDAFGNMTMHDMQPADAVNPVAGANLYLDYLSGVPGAQVDGVLPDYFPPPFPDNGGFDPATGAATPGFAGNRTVDRNEFLAAAGGASGSISGSGIGVVALNDQLSNPADVTNALSSGPGSLASMTEGNVILHGTLANPIVLDGQVAIDGDVVITGYVKGKGAIMASGNVFIPGEIQFLDGTDVNGDRTYGATSGGEVNSLGIAAGGNVVIGDPSHPMFGSGDPVDGTPNTEFNFIMEELAIFNRTEWMKTQPTLPGERVYTLQGTHLVDRIVQPTRTETYFEDQDIYESQDTGRTVTVPIMGWVQTGTHSVDDFSMVQVGTHMVDDYTTVNHPATAYEAAWTEQILTGSHEEPIMENQRTGSHLEPTMEWQQTGTREDPVFEDVFVRTDQVELQRTVNDGPSHTVQDTVEDWEWVTPQHANPFYKGPNYLARFYAYSGSAPVPIFNREGFFDPVASIWSSAERAEGWDTGRLSVADPSDPTDSYLYNADGSAKAVVSTLAPTVDWLSSDLLSELVNEALDGRDANKPVEIDATMYSANSIFGVVPSRGKDDVTGRLLINGGLISADVGVLAPNGIQLNYDKRNGELLEVSDDRRLVMRKALWAPAP